MHVATVFRVQYELNSTNGDMILSFKFSPLCYSWNFTDNFLFMVKVCFLEVNAWEPLKLFNVHSSCSNINAVSYSKDKTKDQRDNKTKHCSYWFPVSLWSICLTQLSSKPIITHLKFVKTIMVVTRSGIKMAHCDLRESIYENQKFLR